MDVALHQIATTSDGTYCYVHARGLLLPQGKGLITLQKLDLSGCDLFDGIEMMKTSDGGKSFSPPRPCEKLRREYFENGISRVMCDATPFFHQKTKKILLTGHTAWYNEKGKILRGTSYKRLPAYAVYDESTGDFGPIQQIELEGEDYSSSGAGCTQIWECENGELLIPIYHQSLAASEDPRSCTSVSVLRCAFDGEKLRLLQIGDGITTTVPRGLGEPSLIRHKDAYFLCLRNDVTGFVAQSRDGLHFGAPIELCFENGQSIGNYNTQQHWLAGDGRLFLVYTRRAGYNDHIFRHRAPLFMAEFDPTRMCLLRDTERIVVPERGARLGNFGCQSFSEETGLVFAAEWMQNDPYGWEACARYGSDNSIFISKISYRKDSGEECEK